MTNNDKKIDLDIDITSDNICPWCYVGKRRLEKALTQVDQSLVNVTISWHPFELDSHLPSDGSLIKLDHYRKKFGEQRVQQMIPMMTETGRKEGIQFSFSGQLGSTFDSHRLLHYVKQQPNGEKHQNQLIDLLFEASFEKEKDLSNHQVLIDLAEKIGFDRDQIKEFLQSDLYKKEIRNQIDENYQRGITGVPHFRFNHRTELSGAQDPQVFLRTFLNLKIPMLN